MKGVSGAARHSRFSWTARLVVFFFALTIGRGAGAGAESVEFVTATGAHRVEIEVARTERARETGLMYRRSMLRNHGMLFIFPSEQPVSMWMKNTYIPLDMVFVSRKGRVTSVTRDAVPMSETIISSGPPAFAVIELNAGAARAMGLDVGDQVRHPSFNP
jgi:uncharacterized membrane protein (UPF0127 family)